MRSPQNIFHDVVKNRILETIITETLHSRMPRLDYPLFTEEGLLLTVVLLIPVLYNLAKSCHKKAKSNN